MIDWPLETSSPSLSTQPHIFTHEMVTHKQQIVFQMCKKLLFRSGWNVFHVCLQGNVGYCFLLTESRCIRFLLHLLRGFPSQIMGFWSSFFLWQIDLWQKWTFGAQSQVHAQPQPTRAKQDSREHTAQLRLRPPLVSTGLFSCCGVTVGTRHPSYSTIGKIYGYIFYKLYGSGNIQGDGRKFLKHFKRQFGKQVKSKETVGNSWPVLKVILGQKYHQNH